MERTKRIPRAFYESFSIIPGFHVPVAEYRLRMLNESENATKGGAEAYSAARFTEKRTVSRQICDAEAVSLDNIATQRPIFS